MTQQSTMGQDYGNGHTVMVWCNWLGLFASLSKNAINVTYCQMKNTSKWGIMALFQDVAGAASQRLLSYKYNTPSISVSIVTSNHNHSLKFHDAYLVQVRGQPKHKHGGGAARISGDWQSGELHFPYLTSRFHQYLPSSVQIYSGVATWPPVLGSIRPCWTSASGHLQALADIQVEQLPSIIFEDWWFNHHHHPGKTFLQLVHPVWRATKAGAACSDVARWSLQELYLILGFNQFMLLSP